MATDREKLEHLLAGGELADTKSGLRRYINASGELNCVFYTDKNTVVNPKSLHLTYCDIYTEPKWYENIPKEGILCKVEQASGGLYILNFKELEVGEETVRLISCMPGVDYGVKYNVKDLTPLTPEQVEAYHLLNSI